MKLTIISIIVTFSRRILCHPIDDPSLIYPDILSSSLLICGCTLKKSEMFIWFVAQVFAYNKQMLQLIFDILHELKSDDLWDFCFHGDPAVFLLFVALLDTNAQLCSHVGIGSEKIPLMACKIDIKPQLENLGAVTVKSVSPNFPLGVISL